MKGTYVEGIKEEVVLSPAHALSLIASGEEHRHVGSNNFNFVSSRSHTIFTLTIESSPSGADDDGEEIKLCARPKLYGYELELHMLTVLNCELNARNLRRGDLGAFEYLCLLVPEKGRFGSERRMWE
ncbi:centromere-associated protein E [Carex littledalei]|uniref:Centromere-associated protein E n=1 Tax=Carex littledalei TaxID=544730 RepID=A0A833V6L1_9POAL|nr:centromere-associated protein E [Carex littledalei]